MKIPFFGGFAEAQSLNVSAQNIKNWYLEKGSNQTAALYPTPGLVTWLQFTPGTVRGMHVCNNVLYVVAGDLVYKVFPGITSGSALVGTMDIGVGPMTITDNGLQVVFCNWGQDIYTLTMATSVFAKVDDEDLVLPGGLAYVDGYVIINEVEQKPQGVVNTGKFYVSDALDATSWDALNFASAEANPDGIVRPFSDHRELWLFGEVTTEIWYNSGAADFTFARIGSGFIEMGLGAFESVAKINNGLAWINEKRQVVWAQGYTPQIISTPELQNVFDQMSTTRDAVAFAYSDNGHEFYQISFPSANKTFCYDMALSLWHERTDYTGSNRHRGNCYAWFDGHHVLGDYGNGKLYSWDQSVYSEDGQAVARMVRSAHMKNDGKRLFFSRVQVEMEPGVGEPVTTFPELLTNGGFETSEEETVFQDWTVSDAVHVTAYSVDHHSGTQCVRLAAATSSGTVPNIRNSMEFWLGNGTDYDLTFWCKNISAVGTVTIISNPISPFDPVTTIANVAITSSPGAWTQQTVTFNVPILTRSVYIYFYAPANGSGGVQYIDDVSLIKSRRVDFTGWTLTSPEQFSGEYTVPGSGWVSCKMTAALASVKPVEMMTTLPLATIAPGVSYTLDFYYYNLTEMPRVRIGPDPHGLYNLYPDQVNTLVTPLSTFGVWTRFQLEFTGSVLIGMASSHMHLFFYGADSATALHYIDAVRVYETANPTVNMIVNGEFEDTAINYSELMLNGGFETGTSGWYIPNWVKSSNDRVTIDESQPYGGDKALKLTTVAGSAVSPYVLTQEPVSVSKGKTYAMELYYLADSVESGDVFSVEISNYLGGFLVPPEFLPGSVPDAAVIYAEDLDPVLTWTRYSVDVTIPQNIFSLGVLIQIKFLLTASGNPLLPAQTIYIDNVSFKESVISTFGNDPQVTLKWSDDGGHTWTNGLSRSLGMFGESKKRMVWNRLGQSRTRAFEVSIQEPVKAVILDAYCDVEPGNN